MAIGVLTFLLLAILTATLLGLVWPKFGPSDPIALPAAD
jgi:hypothetical protein